MLRTILAFGLMPVLIPIHALPQTPPTQQTCTPSNTNGQVENVPFGWESDKCDCTSMTFSITGWAPGSCDSTSRCRWQITVDWSGCMQAEKRSCAQVSHPDCCSVFGIGDWWAWSRTGSTLRSWSPERYRQCLPGTLRTTFRAPCPADQGQGPGRDAWNCDEPIQAGEFDIVSFDLQCQPCNS